MSVIDITSIEDITEITPPGDTTPELATVKLIVDTVQSPETTVAPIGTPVDPTLPDIHPDTMPTEPVTSLLDITGPAPTISILDMGGTTDTAIVPESIVPVAIAPTATISERSTMSGSLGDKIGGFADELRGLKAADEILLQEKQDAKKRLEDAKKAIEDAEIAIDTEIQRIRADEVAIDDTLASLKRR